jgi:hypothetical protein
VGARPTQQSLQPEAIGAVMEVTKWLKPSISVSRIGGSARVQAVTRVNAEQTSKRTMRRPTRQPYRGRLIRRGAMSEDDLRRCAGVEHGGGCLVVVAPVRNFTPPGLPLHRGGPVDRPASAGCRTSDRGDIQASAEFSRRHPCAGGNARNDDQRDGEPGAAGVPRRSRRQWLNGAAMSAACISNVSSIVSSPSNWSRCTRYWSQSGSV